MKQTSTFVLQDCSVCFEEYDAHRIPHSISCGHVFCRPCLDSLVASAPNCPNCRTSFGRKSIRKVVCATQDSPALDASTLSETETIMWQEIESAVESMDENEHRKSLVRDNSKLAAQEAGFSKNMLVALDIMRLLVQVENKNGGVGATGAIEESLRDRIVFLEAQLDETRTTFSANIQDVQTLLSKMQQFESLRCTADEKAFQVTNRPIAANPNPTLAHTHKSPPTSTHAPSSQKKTPNFPQPKHTPLQNALTTEWPSLSEGASRKRVIPPSPTVARSSYQPDTLRSSNLPEPSPAISVPGNTQIQPSSGPSQSTPPTQIDFEGEDSGWRVVGQRPGRPRRSYFTHAPGWRITTASRNYRARDDDEISLIAGETVRVMMDLDDFADLQDPDSWFWCSARGEEGLVPRYCLSVAFRV
ncbi:hypothetical protein BDV93DRAFT_524607 [Ceratobasidium sp. AG-I]|nr:hypothetical protein BDV93DRAFT_524607 [Ceratobasidium sp. AG-I]